MVAQLKAAVALAAQWYMRSALMVCKDRDRRVDLEGQDWLPFRGPFLRATCFSLVNNIALHFALLYGKFPLGVGSGSWALQARLRLCYSA